MARNVRGRSRPSRVTLGHMTERTAELLDEVLKLTHAERAEFAALLLSSLRDDEVTMDPAAVDAAWEEEIRRRADRVHAGEPGIPWERVRAEAEERLRARRPK